MPKAFAHGTVRSWKRGNVMKHGSEWAKLARERIAPVQPIAVVAPTTLGGDAYGAATPFTAEMSSTLNTLAAKLGESDVSDELELLAEKIQSPSSPKGRAAYRKSLASWSKAASKVAQSYKDKLGDLKGANDAEKAMAAQLERLLGTVSGELAQIASTAEKL